MPIITVADLETTGFKQEKGHRIIEFCGSMYDYATRTKLRTYTIRINPLRDIPADASRVHGIFLEDLHEAPTWEKVAGLVSGILAKSSVMVNHNVDFDAPFIGLELARVNAKVPDIQTFCTMKNARWATANGKNPKLGELAWALGVDYDPAKAHAAEYDVDVTAQCLWAGIDRGYFRLPV
jgi:DNA polymerase-3 subunit epsilon